MILTSQGAFIFYLLLILALILGRIPIIGKFFKGIDTLIHESGHFFTTLLTKGEVLAVNIFSDNSGNTITKSKNKFASFLVAISGYIFVSILMLICFYLLHQQKYNIIIFIFLSISIILLALAIRNTYGIIWIVFFIMINFILLYLKNPLYLYVFTVFYANILFVESIISTFYLLKISIKTPKKAGDATIISKLTKLPAWFWSFLLLIIVLIISFISIKYFFPNIKDAYLYLIN